MGAYSPESQSWGSGEEVRGPRLRPRPRGAGVDERGSAATADFIDSRLIKPGFLPDWAGEATARLRELAENRSVTTEEEVQFLRGKVQDLHSSVARMTRQN